jgi:acyl-[acyl carrier protein]--UDP-N-acetylglucosamine O-acyltransferase
LNLEQAKRALAEQAADCPEVAALLDFLARSKRGFIR